MQYHMPIGYRIRNGKVEIDSKREQVVQEIFDEYEKGSSLLKIAESLVERKVENGKGKINWTHVSIGKILENHNYLGTDYYPQIISKEQFERVQQRREEYRMIRGRGKYRPSEQQRLLFSGVLRCAECGAIYSHVEPKVRGIYAPSWRCKNYIYQNQVKCSGGIMPDKQVEKVCVTAINQLIKSPWMVTKCKNPEQRVSPQFREIQSQLNETEEIGTEGLLKLLFKKAECRYATLEVRDYEIKAKEMEELLMGRSELTEFDEELFRGLIKQIYVSKSNTVKVVFHNNNCLEVGYTDED